MYFMDRHKFPCWRIRRQVCAVSGPFHFGRCGAPVVPANVPGGKVGRSVPLSRDAKPEAILKIVDDTFNRTVRVGFTLIELLVVMAIIGLLATLIIPSMIGALERARRAGCLNNLRQIYSGIVFYAADHEGEMPTTENWIRSGHRWGFPDAFNRIVPNTGDSVSGWYQLLHETAFSYVGIDLMICPSMRERREGYTERLERGEQTLLHYDYRYNTRDSYCNLACPPAHDPPTPRMVFSNVRRSKALLSDAGSNRRWRSGARQGTPYTRNGEEGWMSRRWAHQTGGHIVRHDGAGFFIENDPVEPGPHEGGWPAFYQSTFHFYDQYMFPDE
jgi:prepilin-type N-terminal cleavage/methylation domain-containing protein